MIFNRIFAVIISVLVSFAVSHSQVKIIFDTDRQTRVEIRGEKFYINGTPTYKGRSWKTSYGGDYSIEGLLMNARLVQGIFDDLNKQTRGQWAYPDTGEWDPDRNTDEFIRAMAVWKAHGLLGFTLNLQGGCPYGYCNGFPWDNSAFFSDGSLRNPFMQRAERIINRADELGMVVILGLFYFGENHEYNLGFQSIPVNWQLSSDRKRNFFSLLAEITGSSGTPFIDLDFSGEIGGRIGVNLQGGPAGIKIQKMELILNNNTVKESSQFQKEFFPGKDILDLMAGEHWIKVRLTYIYEGGEVAVESPYYKNPWWPYGGYGNR
jgi:hypothetical protein